MNDAFARDFEALVAHARGRPGDEAGLAALAERATLALGGMPAVLEAGFETSGIPDDRSLKGRMLARLVDRLTVAGEITPDELAGLAQALASDDGPIPASERVQVVPIETVLPGSAPAAPAMRAGDQALRLVDGAEGAGRVRQRTGLGREMEALGRAVEAAARRKQWVEALHAAQALVRMEQRFPEVERRTFALEVRRVIARPVLDAFLDLALRQPEERERTVEVMRRLGGPGADAMVDHLKQAGSAPPRRFLLDALAEMPGAIPLLLPLLAGDSDVAARDAAELLGRLGAEQSVPGLARLVDHRDRSVRESALTALARLADRHALEGLHRGLAHADPGTRIAAAAALGGRGAAGLRPLLDALEREPDAAVRTALVLSAARTGSPQAGRALAALLLRRRTLLRRKGWPDAARMSLIRALAEAGGAVGADVVRAVAREGEGEVAAAAEAAATVLRPGSTSS